MTTPACRGFLSSTASARSGLILSDNAAKRRFGALSNSSSRAGKRFWRLKKAVAFLPSPTVWLLILSALPFAGAAPAFASAAQPALTPWTQTAPAPFSLDAINGRHQSLQAFAGKVVLLHFFATWCEPCVAEMTSLQQLSHMTRDKPLAIVAINVAEVDLRVRAFFDRHPVDFPVLLDRDRVVSRSWGISSLPSTIVLDAGLQPRLVVEGDLDWSRPDVVATIKALYPPEAQQKDE
jgi:thiol-disulfide isomerase/thioredoxin